MRLMTRLATTASATAFLIGSLAGIGSVANAQAMAPASVQATTCDPTYGADVATAGNAMAAAASATQAENLSASGLTLVKLRYQYEDTPAPAGCEAVRQVLLQKLALYEDGAFLTLGAILDTKNPNTYTDAVALWKPRMSAANAAGAATPNAAATAVATMAAAVGVCPDSAFTKQVSTDVGGLKGPSETDPSALGQTGLDILKLRYKYEDAIAPAGCELGAKHVAQFFALVADSVLMSLSKLADKANATAYDDFNKKTINDRGSKLFTSLNADFTFAAAPAATMAATTSP